MKKLLLILAFVAALWTTADAQTAANRTARTKISDAVALMPARDAEEYNRLMEDLVSTKEEGIQMLTDMFDDVNNVPLNFALSGWANYVTTPGKSEDQKIFEQGILLALVTAEDPVVQAFYIRLLNVAGTHASVRTLTSLLDDPQLGDPARGALESITDRVGKARIVHYNAPVGRIEKLYEKVRVKRAASLPTIVKAMNDSDRAYRNAALIFAEPYVNDAFYKQLADRLPKLSPEAQVDVITYLGQHGAENTTGQVAAYLNNRNPEVAVAAIWAVKLLGDAPYTKQIIDLLDAPQTTSEVRAQIQQYLYSTPASRVGEPLDFLLQTGSDATKATVIPVLAAKKVEEARGAIYEAINYKHPEVSRAAYVALADIAREEDLPRLFVILENAPADRMVFAENAITAALKTMQPEDQYTIVYNRMLEKLSDLYKYYPVLATTGGEKVPAILTEGFDTSTGEVQEKAFKGLLAWNGIETAEKLYQIALKNDSYYAEALKGYVVKVSESDLTPELKQIKLTEALEIAQTPAQKRDILSKMARTQTLQALMTAGKYLDDADYQLQQQAINTIYHIFNSRYDLYGPAVMELVNKAIDINKDDPNDYGRASVLKHMERLPNEGGFVSMFNGKDLTGWKGLVDDPIKRAAMSPSELAEKQRTADEIMRRDWVVEDGELMFIGKGFDNLCTEKLYGDFELYIDWKLYPDPDADGGIYLRGSPQVQMWDPYRKDGQVIGSGGLFNNKQNPDGPLVLADNEIGRWNTFYIKMVGERATIYLNGQLVVDNVILENYWDRTIPIFETGEIELQAHTTKQGFRNLYIKEIPKSEPYTVSAEEAADGFRPLFDGVSMHEWTGNTQDYIAENGTITLYPDHGYGGNLYTKDEFGNFVIRFEFKLTEGANNGLGIRTPMEGDAAYVGMELQILDDDAAIYSELEEWQYHGSVYGIIAAKRGSLKPVGEWNYQEVIADGNRIKITLNGDVIVDGDLKEASGNGKATLDGKEHPGLFNKKGHIAFLGHGSVVSFRNIRIKELE